MVGMRTETDASTLSSTPIVPPNEPHNLYSIMSLPVEVIRKSGKVLLDLSEPAAKTAVLVALQHDGWVILKAAANTKSIEEARDNKVRVSTVIFYEVD